MTMRSLASSLSMDYLGDLSAPAPLLSDDWMPLAHRLQDYRLWRRLSRLGLTDVDWVKRQRALRQFRDLAAVVDDPAPTFVIAHFLVPHPPYVFDRDGNPLASEDLSIPCWHDRHAVRVVAGPRELQDLGDPLAGEDATSSSSICSSGSL